MKIGIDIRCLTEKQYSGISSFTLNLLRVLFEIDKNNQYILFYNTAKPAKIPEFNYPNVTIKKFSYPNKLFNFCVKFLNFPKLDKLVGGADIFFLPSFHFIALSKKNFSNFSVIPSEPAMAGEPRDPLDQSAAAFSSPKLITIIHDLSFEHNPEFFNFKARLWHKLVNPKKLCQRADAVIAISENTKNDIIKIYNISPEKIKVIYPGITGRFHKIQNQEILKKVKEKYHLPEEFILFLGNLEPRKNIESLIQAVGISKSLPTLVVAGGKGWKYESIYNAAKKYRNKIHFIGYIDSEDKPALYALAKIFAYPSFYEGFGLPPLEAMACETPVVVSHTSSLPEVVADAGIQIDPYDINDLRHALEELNNNPTLQKHLSQKGLIQSKKFSWQYNAESLLKIFKQS